MTESSESEYDVQLDGQVAVDYFSLGQPQQNQLPNRQEQSLDEETDIQSSESEQSIEVNGDQNPGQDAIQRVLDYNQQQSILRLSNSLSNVVPQDVFNSIQQLNQQALESINRGAFQNDNSEESEEESDQDEVSHQENQFLVENNVYQNQNHSNAQNYIQGTDLDLLYYQQNPTQSFPNGSQSAVEQSSNNSQIPQVGLEPQRQLNVGTPQNTIQYRANVSQQSLKDQVQREELQDLIEETDKRITQEVQQGNQIIQNRSQNLFQQPSLTIKEISKQKDNSNSQSTTQHNQQLQQKIVQGLLQKDVQNSSEQRNKEVQDIIQKDQENKNILQYIKNTNNDDFISRPKHTDTSFKSNGKIKENQQQPTVQQNKVDLNQSTQTVTDNSTNKQQSTQQESIQQESLPQIGTPKQNVSQKFQDILSSQKSQESIIHQKRKSISPEKEQQKRAKFNGADTGFQKPAMQEGVKLNNQIPHQNILNSITETRQYLPNNQKPQQSDNFSDQSNSQQKQNGSQGGSQGVSQGQDKNIQEDDEKLQKTQAQDNGVVNEQVQKPPQLLSVNDLFAKKGDKVPDYLNPQATKQVPVHLAHGHQNSVAGNNANQLENGATANKRKHKPGPDFDIASLAPPLKGPNKRKGESKNEGGVIEAAPKRAKQENGVQYTEQQIALMGGNVKDKGPSTQSMPPDEMLINGGQLPRKNQDRKEREKKKRQIGQSSHAHWKTEEEMAMRQQFDA